MDSKEQGACMDEYDSEEQAIKEWKVFWLDVTWLPCCLVETVEGKFKWIGLVDYAGTVEQNS